jgi:hypothetical protein
VSELTPREWQDIEKAKAALRIDAGWADGIDDSPVIVLQDASPAATTALDGAPDAASEPDRDADEDEEIASESPRSAPSAPSAPATRSTPESQGLPTAG